MFVIQDTDFDDPKGDKCRVIDHERDVWLQRNHAGPSPVVKFLLVWQGREIPFAASEHPLGNRTLQWKISHFGQVGAWRLISRDPPKSEKIYGYAFSGPEERRQALLLAIEALLNYGSIYDGPDRVKRGYSTVVLADDRTYTLADFVK